MKQLAKAKKTLSIAIVAFLLADSGCFSDGAVSTIAGSAGKSGSADGIGTAALFHTPLSVTTDGQFLYVADTRNSAIRRIDIRNATVTTIAGQPGRAGRKDGPGQSAQFFSPSGIVYHDGYLFVADTGNHQIRKISALTGVVSTLTPRGLPTDEKLDMGSVGSRTIVPYAITSDGTHLYLTDPFFNTIWKLDISSGAATIVAGRPGVRGHDDGPANLATFDSPMGIAVLGNSLYVSDTRSNAIRKVTQDTDTVTTIAGNVGVAGHEDGVGIAASFDEPVGLGVEEGDLYVADGANRTLRRIALSTLQVVTIAGQAGRPGYKDGKNKEALFEGPGGIVVWGGVVYIVDSLGQTVRAVRIEQRQDK